MRAFCARYIRDFRFPRCLGYDEHIESPPKTVFVLSESVHSWIYHPRDPSEDEDDTANDQDGEDNAQPPPKEAEHNTDFPDNIFEVFGIFAIDEGEMQLAKIGELQVIMRWHRTNIQGRKHRIKPRAIESIQRFILGENAKVGFSFVQVVFMSFTLRNCPGYLILRRLLVVVGFVHASKHTNDLLQIGHHNKRAGISVDI